MRGGTDGSDQGRGDTGRAGRSRPRRRALLEVGVLWVLAVGAALAVASQTKIGPTILVVVGTHGVHLGDLLFVAGAVAACAVVTWGRVGPRRTGGVRHPSGG